MDDGRYGELWQECHRYALLLNTDDQRQVSKWLGKLEAEGATSGRRKVRDEYARHLVRGLKSGHLPLVFHRDPPTSPLAPLRQLTEYTMGKVKEGVIKPPAPDAFSKHRLGAPVKRREAPVERREALRRGLRTLPSHTRLTSDRPELLQRVSIAVIKSAASSPDITEDLVLHDEDADDEGRLRPDVVAAHGLASAASLAQFLVMVSPRVDDKGEALRSIAEQELGYFRDAVRDVGEAQSGDVELALALDHDHVREYADELLHGAKANLREAEDKLRKLCPDFNWRDYREDSRYLVNVIDSFASKRPGHERLDSVGVHERKTEYRKLFHKLQQVTQFIKKEKGANDGLSRELEQARDQHHERQVAMTAVENNLDLNVADLEQQAGELRCRREELAEEIASLYVELDEKKQRFFARRAR